MSKLLAGVIWKVRVRRGNAVGAPPPGSSSGEVGALADWNNCLSRDGQRVDTNEATFFGEGCGLAVVLGLSVHKRVWIQLEELESGQSTGRSGTKRLNGSIFQHKSSARVAPASSARWEHAQLGLSAAEPLNPRASRVCRCRKTIRKTILAVM